jgi:predicted phage terminase large subunit-like protein
MDPETGEIIPPASIHHEFEKLLRGSVGNAKREGFYNLLAILPRGCAKSTYAGVFFLIWCIVFTNKRYIIFVGATTDSIKDHFATIKEEIKRNDMLHLIGVNVLEKGDDNRVSFDVVGPPIPGFEKQYRGTGGRKTVRIEAYTASSFPRGKKRGAARPDAIIIDDLERKGQGTQPGVESKNYRAKILDLFEASIVPSGFSKSSLQIIMLGTIMHEAQLLYQLYLQSQAGICYPPFKSIKYSLIENYGTPEEYSIWPEKMSVEDFRLYMESATHKGTANIAYNEFLSLPTSPDNEIFDKDKFLYYILRAGEIFFCDKHGVIDYNRKTVKLKDTSVIVTADLAFTVNDRSDYTAYAVTAVDKDENCYILDIPYGKWGNDEKIENAELVLNRYKPMVFAMEKARGGETVIELLNKELRGIPNFDGIIPLSTGGLSKEDRIINYLEMPYKDGRMYHRFEADYLEDYEDQVVSVTRDGIKSKHDDLVDAVSYAYQITDIGAIYNDDDSGDDDYENNGSNCI